MLSAPTIRTSSHTPPVVLLHPLQGSIERKAYNAAEAASRTTTGERPKSEVVQAYARKLGQLVIEAVRDGALVNGKLSCYYFLAFYL